MRDNVTKQGYNGVVTRTGEGRELQGEIACKGFLGEEVKHGTFDCNLA